jgi:MFS family permease
VIAVLIGFLVIGAALPVLPFFVRDGLGFGPAMVGLVAGCQFAAALIARIWAGQAADTKGAKWAVFNKLTVAKFSCKSAAGVQCKAGITFRSLQLRRTASIRAKQGK